MNRLDVSWHSVKNNVFLGITSKGLILDKKENARSKRHEVIFITTSILPQFAKILKKTIKNQDFAEITCESIKFLHKSDTLKIVSGNSKIFLQTVDAKMICRLIDLHFVSSFFTENRFSVHCYVAQMCKLSREERKIIEYAPREEFVNIVEEIARNSYIDVKVATEFFKKNSKTLEFLIFCILISRHCLNSLH